MTTALEGDEGSAPRPGCSLPPGKTWYPLYRKLGGPQGRSVHVWEISPPLGFHSWTVQHVANPYTDWATRLEWVELCLNSRLLLRDVETNFFILYYFFILSFKIIQIKNMDNVSFYVPMFCFLCDQFLANCKKLRFHLKRLVVPQLLKIFSKFLQYPKLLYRVHRSPTIVPILCPIIPDCAFTNDIRSILILFFYLGLGLLSGLFPSYFSTKTLYFSRLPLRPTHPAHLIYLDSIARKLCGELYKS